MLNWSTRSLALAAMVAMMAGCDEGPLVPVESEAGTLMVDASTEWTFVRLGTEATPVAVSNAATSSDWDMAFFGTAVMLNGGAAGPGGVSGYCVCQNEGATNAQVLGMTAAAELSDFEAVTLTDLPSSEDAWTADVLAPAIADWYSYNPTTHEISADPSRVWKIRLAEATSPGYVKFHVTGMDGAARTHAGKVTIEYALQTAAGAPMGATRTAVLDGTSGRVYFDFARGEVTDASDWDISLDGYDIRVNSGVSGSGKAGAVLASEGFAGMTDASDAPSQIYKADAFGGVFNEHRWYRYNLTGNHDITPTFDVYLIRRGDDVYKVQLIGYYNQAGDSRQVTLRYAKLGE